MPHELGLIVTLTAGLTVAVLFGFGTSRLGLSPLVGYLLAGVVLSQDTPGLEVDKALASQMAEIGIILLMFGVGLKFHPRELLAVKNVAIPGAILQSVAATLLGMLAVMAFGWSWTEGIVFGLAISVASTVVLTRILAENNSLHTRTGHIAVGWLVVEDILMVLVLVLLPELADSTNESVFANVAGATISALLKLAALIVLMFFFGQRLIPQFMEYVARTGSRELFTLTTLVVALGISVGNAYLFGSSMALGAFLAGMVVGQSEFCNRAATEALPFRDAFAVLFFVSVGMLFNPTEFFQNSHLIAITILIILIGKPLAAMLVIRVLRYPFRTALAVGIALAQIGEFSFILATLGNELGVLPSSALNILVAASITSITVNPLCFKLVKPISRFVEGHKLLNALLNPTVTEKGNATVSVDFDEEHHAVVVGFGPVGQTIARLLAKNGFRPVIIELNIDTARNLSTRGLSVVYGEASRRETLELAGIERAEALILTSSTNEHSKEAIRIARELNPDIRILARANYLHELSELASAGAERIVSAEGEVALAMAEDLLQQLGATFDQIDRERQRLRQELLEMI